MPDDGEEGGGGATPGEGAGAAAGRFVAGRKVEYLKHCAALKDGPRPPAGSGLRVARWVPDAGVWRDQNGDWHLVRQDILRLANDAIYTAPRLPAAALKSEATREAVARAEQSVLSRLREAAAEVRFPSDPFSSKEAAVELAVVLQRAAGVLDPKKIEKGWPVLPWELDLLPQGAEALRLHYAALLGAGGGAATARVRARPPSPQATWLQPPLTPEDLKARGPPLLQKTLVVVLEPLRVVAREARQDPRMSQEQRVAAAKLAGTMRAEGLPVPAFATERPQEPAAPAGLGGVDAGSQPQLQAAPPSQQQPQLQPQMGAAQGPGVESMDLDCQQEEEEPQAKYVPPPPPVDPELGEWMPAIQVAVASGARRARSGLSLGTAGGGRAAWAPLSELRRRAAAGQLPWGITVQRRDDGLMLPLTKVPMPAEALVWAGSDPTAARAAIERPSGAADGELPCLSDLAARAAALHRAPLGTATDDGRISEHAPPPPPEQQRPQALNPVATHRRHAAASGEAVAPVLAALEAMAAAMEPDQGSPADAADAAAEQQQAAGQVGVKVGREGSDRHKEAVLQAARLYQSRCFQTNEEVEQRRALLPQRPVWCAPPPANLLAAFCLRLSELLEGDLDKHIGAAAAKAVDRACSERHKRREEAAKLQQQRAVEQREQQRRQQEEQQQRQQEEQQRRQQEEQQRRQQEEQQKRQQEEQQKRQQEEQQRRQQEEQQRSMEQKEQQRRQQEEQQRRQQEEQRLREEEEEARKAEEQRRREEERRRQQQHEDERRRRQEDQQRAGEGKRRNGEELREQQEQVHGQVRGGDGSSESPRHPGEGMQQQQQQQEEGEAEEVPPPKRPKLNEEQQPQQPSRGCHAQKPEKQRHKPGRSRSGSEEGTKEQEEEGDARKKKEEEGKEEGVDEEVEEDEDEEEEDEDWTDEVPQRPQKKQPLQRRRSGAGGPSARQQLPHSHSSDAATAAAVAAANEGPEDGAGEGAGGDEEVAWEMPESEEQAQRLSAMIEDKMKRALEALMDWDREHADETFMDDPTPLVEDPDDYRRVVGDSVYLRAIQLTLKRQKYKSEPRDHSWPKLHDGASWRRFWDDVRRMAHNCRTYNDRPDGDSQQYVAAAEKLLELAEAIRRALQQGRPLPNLSRFRPPGEVEEPPPKPARGGGGGGRGGGRGRRGRGQHPPGGKRRGSGSGDGRH